MQTRVIGISSKGGGLHELLKMPSKAKYQLHSDKSSKDRKGLHPRMKNVNQNGQAPDIMAPTSLIILKKQVGDTWKQEAV